MIITCLPRSALSLVHNQQTITSIEHNSQHIYVHNTFSPCTMSLLTRLSEPLESNSPTPAPSEPALSDRLWTTKLVPFPNAPDYPDEPPPNPSDDEDEDVAEREPALEPLREGDSGALRTHALLIESETLLHMATRNVMELVSALMPQAPLGLEWVSDTTLVLVFTSEGELSQTSSSPSHHTDFATPPTLTCSPRPLLLPPPDP